MERYNIAIIGIGGVFPGANNVREFWKNIEKGDTFISEMPENYWKKEYYFDKDTSNKEKSYTFKGAFLRDFEFPYLEYKIPPNVMKSVDPAQHVALEATREALADAGIEPESEQLDKAATVIGASGVDGFAHATIYLRRNHFFEKIKKQLKKKGFSDKVISKLSEEFTEEIKKHHGISMSSAAVGLTPSAISNRVAQVFGIKGFNMTVDAACASSFSALNVACHSLMAGDTRLVVAGGIDLGVNPSIYIGFSNVEGLSFSGISNPFDHTADGLVIGEGGGVVILKRLEDAIADGDKIRAVIRGVGSSSDGAGQAIYAPNSDGRAKAFRQALKTSATKASDVQYIEAHATSTVVGDANEYDAIVKAYEDGRKPAEDPLYLGSVKYQIGHLKAGAGIAGLIKTVLAMENEKIPHMPLYSELTPHAERESDKFVIPSKLQKWEPGKDGKRVAAITSSGFGGANYHAVIEQGGEYVPQKRIVPDRKLAVVGVSCKVAGADNPDSFWENLSRGKDVFSYPEPEELGWQHHVDFGPENERINTRAVSRLEDFSFNFLRYKIFPNSVSQIATSQLLGVDLADNLLKQKGFTLDEPKNIGVSVGAIHDDYFSCIFDPMITDMYIDNLSKCPSSSKMEKSLFDEVCSVVKDEVRKANPPVTEHTLPGWMGNIIAGRMANKLNLQGPNIVVDSACSSGISAMLPAMYQLMFGEEDMMISGGLNRQLTDVFTSGVCAINALAEYKARPFDKEGSGYLIGEGGVLYMLKRYKDAEKDGDEIIAVVDSIGGSSEAESNSMIAPTETAARRAIARTFEKSDVNPENIGVVDAHGSANQLSDIVEIKSIFEEVAKNRPGSVKISAVKSHVGHLYGGSGAASMFSVIKSINTGFAPGIRNLENLRPEIQEFSKKVLPISKTSKLEKGKDAGAILSLGLGGANYFAVIKKAGDLKKKKDNKTNSFEKNITSSKDRSSDNMKKNDGVFLSTAQDDNDLLSALEKTIKEKEIPSFLPTGGIGVRYATTYENTEDLKHKLKTTISFLKKGHDVAPLQSQGIFFSRDKEKQEKLAFCFPGQGTHYVGMGRFLYENNSTFKNVMDTVNKLSQAELDFDLISHVYGEENDPAVKKELGTIIGAQVSLFAVEVGMAKVFEATGVKPDVLIGHSFGEISALTFSGVWDLETGFHVVKNRIESAEFAKNSHPEPLGMMSIICSDKKRDAILKLAGDKVVLTNINAPGRFIFSGEKKAVENAVDLAENFGLEAELLPIGSAFHSHFMEPARERYRKALAKLPCGKMEYPILSTVTGIFVEEEMCVPEKMAEHLSKQLVTPINFPREITRLFDEGVRHYLEVGPKWSLTKMISRILKDHYFRANPSLHPKIGDAEVFRRARAFLSATGHLTAHGELDNLSNFISDDMITYLQEEEPETLEKIEQLHHRFLSWYKRHKEDKREIMGSATSAPAEENIAVKRSVSEPSVKTVAGISEKSLEHKIKQKLVEMTGYPEDMLESGLNLEADLGIDSIQRAELWVGTAEELGIDKEARPNRKISTISDFALALAELTKEGETEDAEETKSKNSEKETPLQKAAPKTENLEHKIKQKLVEMTGYPEDMLESGLNLEADLGIDSIQRAELWV
ncbi:MAG: beta-ketoacyl synthase N-terminal-like domain-containing protein, partial [bacterium]